MGGIARKPIQRFGSFTQPTPYRGDTRHCTLQASPVLTHSAGKIAVARAVKANTETPVLLCADCTAYVEAYRWAHAMGLTIAGDTLLMTLAMVWRSPTGYLLPKVRETTIPIRRLENVAHHLGNLVKLGLLQKVADRYLMRDACPSCYRRGVHDKDCGLRFDPEHFAVRREAYVAG